MVWHKTVVVIPSHNIDVSSENPGGGLPVWLVPDLSASFPIISVSSRLTFADPSKQILIL